MTVEDILQDYREDWFLRCVKIKNIDYKAFDGKTVLFKAQDCVGSILDTFLKIFRYVSEFYAENFKLVTEYDCGNDADFQVVWDLKCCPLKTEFKASKQKILYVCDHNNIDRCWIENAVVLYCGDIFGTGYGFSCVPRNNNAVSVLDFFGSQIFLLSKIDEVENGIYYCGYGECNFNAKHIEDLGYEQLITFDDAKYMYDFFKEKPNERFFFGNTYNGNLQLLHSLLFKCLLEFDRICKKHNIKYFLGGGTLLGAVRHGGMIPWDDDMDVMMLREDYDKFLSVVNDEISDGMFFQSSETDSQYHSIFTKIRLDGTRFVTSFSRHFPEMHQGIFIDIFVHDHTSNNKYMQKLHVFKTLFARSMVFHKWEQTPMHFYGKLKLVCKFATKYINNHSFKKLEKIQDKTVRKYNKKNTKYLYDGTGEHLRHGAFPAEWLDDVEYMDFNGVKLPVPKNYDEYLKYSYGDYENWIPASSRKAGHDIVDVDFGSYMIK